MKILITGIAGFVGSKLATGLKNFNQNLEIQGIDNFSRRGSDNNIFYLQKADIKLFHGDIRLQSDIDTLPFANWVIDCAANPSVLAGLDSQVSSRQLIENNLHGTINLLEYCKRHKAGLILLSTSRVYSAELLANIEVEPVNERYQIKKAEMDGFSDLGISERFPTIPPISLYGASKLASEQLSLEYGNSFDFPVWINRCGVLAGAGQFGKADQGIFSYWIHSFKERKPLKYFGFGGTGYQVRDALHPNDLIPLLIRQICEPNWEAPKIVNLGGGIENSLSLRELSNWCKNRFKANRVESTIEERPMDAPWIVLDSSVAQNAWNWRPKIGITEIIEEIADHADKYPNWLDLC